MPIDPTITAAILTTLSVLRSKAGETIVSEAIKDAYAWTKDRLGIHAATEPVEVEPEVQKALASRPELAKEIAEYLSRQDNPTVRELGQSLLKCAGPAESLVGTVYAQKSIVANQTGDITM